MTEDRIIEKVQKLLRLAESSNEHEAALAAERAQELMLRYGIKLAQVAATKERGGIGVDRVLRRQRLDPWRTALAGAVAESMGGQIVYANDYRKWSGEIEFWGQRGMVQGMVALYDYLEAQCVTISAVEVAAEWLRGTLANAAQSMRWRRSFLMGMIERVALRLEARRLVVGDESADNSRALVLAKDAVQRAVEDAYPDLATPGKVKVDPLAYLAGTNAGAQVDLGDTRIGKRREELEAR